MGRYRRQQPSELAELLIDAFVAMGKAKIDHVAEMCRVFMTEPRPLLLTNYAATALAGAALMDTLPLMIGAIITSSHWHGPSHVDVNAALDDAIIDRGFKAVGKGKFRVDLNSVRVSKCH